MSRGSPTLTESSRAIGVLRPATSLVDGEIPIRAVRNHRLPRLERKYGAVQLDRHDVGLERHEIGDATNLGLRLAVGPRGPMRLADIVVAAEALVRTERLLCYRGQRRLVDVGARPVPTRRKAGLVEHDRPVRVGHNAIVVPD